MYNSEFRGLYAINDCLKISSRRGRVSGGIVGFSDIVFEPRDSFSRSLSLHRVSALRACIGDDLLAFSTIDTLTVICFFLVVQMPQSVIQRPWA